MSEMRVVLMVAGDAAELLHIGAVLKVLSEHMRQSGGDWLVGTKHSKHTQHLSLIHISEPTRPY